MKFVFLQAPLIVGVAFLMIVSKSPADPYFRSIAFYVNIYAYQGRNGEAGPYYCGKQLKKTRKLFAFHESGEKHLGNGSVIAAEWFPSCGMSYDDVPYKDLNTYIRKMTLSKSNPKDPAFGSLATSWGQLRQTYLMPEVAVERPGKDTTTLAPITVDPNIRRLPPSHWEAPKPHFKEIECLPPKITDRHPHSQKFNDAFRLKMKQKTVTQRVEGSRR